MNLQPTITKQIEKGRMRVTITADLIPRKNKLRLKTKKVAKKPKVVKKEIKPEVVNVYKLAPKTDNIIEIMNIVEEIANENETNKVLEKTLITLRKLQQDIAWKVRN